jgi:uncharacterized protein (DUF4415 family)
MTTFHVFKAGELQGQLEAADEGAARSTMRSKYGRAASLVLVSDEAGAVAINRARIESERIAQAQAERMGRPRKDDALRATTINLDATTLEYFQSSGPGWQARMRGALAEYVKKQTKGQR